MNPVMVEVIAHAPTQYFHCQHCEFVWNQAEIESVKKFHTDALATSLPTELLTDYRTLSAWITNAIERFGGRVVFKVIDAASLEGVYKSLRYGARKYPAVIVNGKDKYIGADFAQAETLIARAL
jgi:hypothetical protein